MTIDIEREDNFNDILRKAIRGTRSSGEALSATTGIDYHRLAHLLSDGAQPNADESQKVAAALKLNAPKLAGIGIDNWRPAPQDLDPRVGHQVNDPQPSNGYFLILKEERVGAVVDPGGSPDNIATTFRRAGLDATHILVTHRHADHVGALLQTRRAFPNATVVVHELEAAAVGAAAKGAKIVRDGESVPFGHGQIRVLHTPGHTDGSVCFLFDRLLFTGDTLFAGSVGGAVGERFGYADLLRGVSEKVLSLPEATVVLPGHGPPSTIGEERAHNPFF